MAFSFSGLDRRSLKSHSHCVLHLLLSVQAQRESSLTSWIPYLNRCNITFGVQTSQRVQRGPATPPAG